MAKDKIIIDPEKWSLEGFAVSARDHVGRILDNTRVQEILEGAILAGCAYFGAKATKSTDPEDLAGGALAGMIGYKLATTMGGTPPVSQIAGLVILGAIGVTNVTAKDYGDPVAFALKGGVYP